MAGITTTEDVVGWFRDKMQAWGVQPWFQPSVEIQAHGQGFEAQTAVRSLILPGDLLHCDVGFHYLGLTIDQQQEAYVLRWRETAAPEGLTVMPARQPGFA